MPVSFSRFYKERLLGTCIADQLWKESKMKRKRWKCNKDIEFSAVPFYLAKTKKSFKVTLISAEMGYSGFFGKDIMSSFIGNFRSWNSTWRRTHCMEVLLNDIEVLCLAPPYFGFKILAEYYFFQLLCLCLLLFIGKRLIIEGEE